jgi:hypothetical protein
MTSLMSAAICSRSTSKVGGSHRWRWVASRSPNRAVPRRGREIGRPMLEHPSAGRPRPRAARAGKRTALTHRAPPRGSFIRAVALMSSQAFQARPHLLIAAGTAQWVFSKPLRRRHPRPSAGAVPDRAAPPSIANMIHGSSHICEVPPDPSGWRVSLRRTAQPAEQEVSRTSLRSTMSNSPPPEVFATSVRSVPNNTKK